MYVFENRKKWAQKWALKSLSCEENEEEEEEEEEEKEKEDEEVEECEYRQRGVLCQRGAKF